MKNKIIFSLILLLTCLCVCFLFGCSSNGKENSDGDKNSTSSDTSPVVTSDKQVLNEFDHYDDLKKFAFNPEGGFDGSIKVNTDENYIKSGTGSMSILINNANPSLYIYAKDIGLTNMTNVKRFGIYLYNKSEFAFKFGLVARSASGDYIYNEQVEVAVGVNEFEFETDRSLLQYIGTGVYYFELQFSSVGRGTVVYLDDFYAITTSEKAEPIQEIDDVLDGISDLDINNRTEVFNLYEKYNSLQDDYKACIYTYPILKAAIDSLYMNDLATARIANPDTVLFFDEPFGEAQIESKSTIMTTCNYSTEWAAEGENGSLKISFAESNMQWCSMRTSAKIDIENPYIYLTIFNDSDQRKMIELNWRGDWIIPAHSEKTIKCESKWLTRNEINAAGGYIQICGLVGESVLGTAPEGSIYISSVKSFNPNTDIQPLRQGADSNTLFFFDRSVGQKMILSSSDGLRYSYSTDMAYQGEDGSLKLTFENAGTQETASYLTAGYALTENDYVYFHVYNDTDSVVQIMLYYNDGVRLNPHQWSDVVIPAEEFDRWSHFRFWCVNYGKLVGNLYLSKATVIPGNSVVNLSELDSDETWSFGDLTLRGPLQYDNLRTHPSNTLTNPLGYAPYLYSGEIQINYMEYEYGRITFSLKNPIALTEDKYFEITARSDDRLDGMFVYIYDESGSMVHSLLYPLYGYRKKDAGNGYTKYLIRVPGKAGKTIAKFTIQGIGVMSSNDAMQFTLKDMKTYSYAESVNAGWDPDSVYTANEKALAIMTTSSSYEAHYYAGTPGGGTKLTSDSFKALGGMGGSGRRGFMLSKAAIKSLLDLGFGTMSFEVNTSSYSGNPVPGYVYLWISGGTTEWIINTPDLGADVYASGSTVEIDLVAMYNDIVQRGSDAGLGFVLRTDASTDASTAAYITLSDISLSVNEGWDPNPVYTANENALLIMTSASSYIESYGVGSPVNPTKVDSNTFKAQCGFNIRRGYVLSKTAIKSIMDLGFGTMSFTLTVTPNDVTAAAGYVNFFITGATAYSDYLLTSADLGTTIYASGRTVEIDLAKLYVDINAAGKDGLGFYLMSDASTDYTAAANWLTLSNISFTAVDPYAVIAKSSSYADNTQGAFGGVTAVDDDTVKILCLHNAANGRTDANGMPGFLLTKAAIQSLVSCGYTTMTFTATAEQYEDNTPVPGYFIMYLATGTSSSWQSGAEYVDVGSNRGGYYVSGATITINISVLAEQMAASDAGLLFNFMAGQTWASGCQEAYLTFSNITFA